MSMFKAYAFPIHWEYRFKPIISSLQTKPETRMYVYLPNTFVGVTYTWGYNQSVKNGNHDNETHLVKSPQLNTLIRR